MTVVTCKQVASSASSVSSADLRNVLFYFNLPVVEVEILSTELSVHRPFKDLIGLYSFSLIGKKNHCYSLNSIFRQLCSHIIEISARFCFPDLLGNLLQLLKAYSEAINWSLSKLLLFAYLYALQPDRERNQWGLIGFNFHLLIILHVLKWTVISFSYVPYGCWTDWLVILLVFLPLLKMGVFA